VLSICEPISETTNAYLEHHKSLSENLTPRELGQVNANYFTKISIKFQPNGKTAPIN
jgi:hypothetical protein